MDTQNLISFLLGNNLHESLHVLVRLGPGVGSERELSNLKLHALTLQFLLRLSDPRNLRMRIYDRRDGVVVDVSVTRFEVLHSGDALFFRLVGEHGSKSYIADTLDSGDRSVELVVDHDSAPVVDFDSNVLQAKALDVWPATDGDKDDISLQRLLLAVLGSLCLDEYLAVGLVSTGHLRIELELDALLGEGLLERLATTPISIVSEN